MAKDYDEITGWFTVNKVRVPIFGGESKEDSIERRTLEDKYFNDKYVNRMKGGNRLNYLRLRDATENVKDKRVWLVAGQRAGDAPTDVDKVFTNLDKFLLAYSLSDKEFTWGQYKDGRIWVKIVDGGDKSGD